MSKQTTPRSDRFFYVTLCMLGGVYVALVLAMLAADVAYTSPSHLLRALRTPEIRFALYLSLLTSTTTTLLSVWVATPLGYLLSRWGRRSDSGNASRKHRPRRALLLGAVESLIDIPLVLPPLVVGVSLLVAFRFPPLSWVGESVVYRVPAVVLAQFAVVCALAVRTMRMTFDQIPERYEQVALTLGASRAQAFWFVLMPQARRGLLEAATLSWTRAIGEFGPVLVFASATRLRTEVLPTSVYLELQGGDLQSALAVSLLMVAIAILVLAATRLLGMRHLT